MRHQLFAILVPLLISISAKAELDSFCEPWKGGTEIHCISKKISGTAPDYGAFIEQLSQTPTSYSYSGWWSVCGLAGVILYSNRTELEDHKIGLYNHFKLDLPNQCFELYFFDCSHNGSKVACTSVMSARPAPPR